MNGRQGRLPELLGPKDKQEAHVGGGGERPRPKKGRARKGQGLGQNQSPLPGVPHHGASVSSSPMWDQECMLCEVAEGTNEAVCTDSNAF